MRPEAISAILQGDEACVLPIKKRDKTGPKVDRYDAAQVVVNYINNEPKYFNWRTKGMSKEIENAQTEVEKSILTFDNAMTLLVAKEKSVVESVKKMSGNIRAASESLNQGLARIEKQANFDKLERYVDLIERAAAGMTILAELERNGKLDKIVGALK